MSRSDPNRPSTSGGSDEQVEKDNPEDYQTAVVQRAASAYWGNPRFRWQVFPLSPIPESPNRAEDASETESAPDLNELHQKLQESLQNLSFLGKAGKGQAEADEDSSPNASVASNSSPTYSPEHNAANVTWTRPVDLSSPNSSSDDTDNSLNLSYNPTGGRRTRRVSNASTLVLTPDGTASPDTSAGSPASPNSPQSFRGKVKRHRRRMKTIRHYTRGVERLQFNRYILALFRSTLSPTSLQKQPRRSRKSGKQPKSTVTPSSAPASSAAASTPGPSTAGPSTAGLSTSAGPTGQPQSQPQQTKPRTRPVSDPNREISKISKQSMAVLNTIVKDLIHRFAVESDRLLADSRFSTLRESEALAAIRMILRHRADLCQKVIQQHEQLAATMARGKRGKQSKQHPTAFSTPSAATPGSAQSTPPGSPAAPEPVPSRYGAGTSPPPGPSGISRR